MISTIWATVVCVQWANSCTTSSVLVWLVCLVRFVNVWMYAIMKCLLRLTWLTRRLFLLSLTHSSERMLCLSLWTRQIHWLKLRINVVCLHWDRVVCLVNVLDLRFVTYTIRIMVVFVQLKLLRDRTSVWSLLCVYMLRLTILVLSLLRTVRLLMVRWTFLRKVYNITLQKKKKNWRLPKEMLHWMITASLFVIEWKLVLKLISRSCLLRRSIWWTLLHSRLLLLRLLWFRSWNMTMLTVHWWDQTWCARQFLCWEVKLRL